MAGGKSKFGAEKYKAQKGLAGDVSALTSPVLTLCQESRDLPDNPNLRRESTQVEASVGAIR
jgi:hypothetical protein